ncbi:hypothetical protein TYRP_011760 [Tyrophagus putrescentiae]|nr:hypothetical protein TYRP_011760 [Tyrophagus putrescentiae]
MNYFVNSSSFRVLHHYLPLLFDFSKTIVRFFFSPFFLSVMVMSKRQDRERKLQLKLSPKIQHSTCWYGS